MKLAYFDCVSGISGDMTLAALVSAGWPAEELRAIPERLKLSGVEIEVSPVTRGPFAALRVDVRAPGKQPHRHLKHVRELIESGDLTPGIRERALATFQRLAQAEAEVHGSTVEKVHFHEVGALDALVDIVGACAGLEALGVEQLYCSTLPLGGGTVTCEHGVIPVPAPATALLLRGAPVRMGPVEMELVTPTGAALVAARVERWGGPPPFRLEAVGTGAGARDLPGHPNVLRLLLGTTESAAASRTVAVLETAIDDASPQILADLLPRLLAAGALDAMLVPALMKKGRPGQWLVVIAEPGQADELAQRVLAWTPSLGVRVREERRIEAERFQAAVKTSFGEIEMKVARLADGRLRAQPEFESVRQAAERAGCSLLEVSAAALAAWEKRS
jgi:uncharacterized protein (TIGR00299 family) protein